MVGRIFVITGTLKSPRNKVKRIIESHGDHVNYSVSKNVNYVVAGDDVAGTNKLNKAHELGIPVISEERLWRMLGSRPLVEDNAGRVLPMRIYGRASTRRSPSRRTSHSPTKKRRTTSKSPIKRRNTTSPYKRQRTTRPFVRLARSRNVTKIPARMAPHVTI